MHSRRYGVQVVSKGQLNGSKQNALLDIKQAKHADTTAAWESQDQRQCLTASHAQSSDDSSAVVLARESFFLKRPSSDGAY